MKALRYDGPGGKLWTQVPDAEVRAPTDAVVRVDATTICGTDLHILNGDVPSVAPGTVLGHEAVGVVVDVGAAVTTVAPGDRVLISCITSCGRCRFCREAVYGQCVGGGGWILGNRIDGTQAELVRVPFADTSTHLLPSGLPAESALMLSDILPTSFEVGVLNGAVGPGDTVAVVGAGPIGLAAITTARLFSPGAIIAVDPAAPRREAAKRFGADLAIDTTPDPLAAVMAHTDGLGADVVIEAVGMPAAFELCADLVRPGGHLANVGVHGSPATLHLEKLWSRNITITTGLVDTYSTPKLLAMLATGHLDAAQFVTHRFAMDDIEHAYEVFARPVESGALKIALHRDT